MAGRWPKLWVMSAMMPKTEAPPEATIRLPADRRDALHGRAPDMSKLTNHRSKTTTSHESTKKGTEERSGRPATLKSTEGKLRRELPDLPWLNTRVNTLKCLHRKNRD
jgi:hypothetical protein